MKTLAVIELLDGGILCDCSAIIKTKAFFKIPLKLTVKVRDVVY